MRVRNSGWLILLASLMPLLSGCHATYTALETGRLASSTDGGNALVVIGQGRYAYRFTLIDPHTGKPWPNRPYALTTGRHNHYHLPFVADEKNVYQGVSDAEGKTALFRLPVRIRDQDWDLRERFGSGPYGETFRLEDDSTGKYLADFPYLLMICSTPPQYHLGYSYPNGDTAYSASAQPETVAIFIGGSFDEDDLPKSCDEPDDVQPGPNEVNPTAPAASADQVPESSVEAADATAGSGPADMPPVIAFPDETPDEKADNQLFDLISGAQA
jgi:hypothetical protein